MNNQAITKTMRTLLLLAALVALAGNSAFATGSVTPATGGSAIPADTAGGAYTSLSGPVIVETDGSGMSAGTMVLNAPAGFEFDTTANSVTLTVTGIGVLALPTSQTATPTSSTITMTILVGSILSHSTFTWSGIKVRPVSGAPQTSGNITYSGTSSGVAAGANMGTLTLASSAASKLLVLLPGETAAPGTATGRTGTPTAQVAGVPFNVTVRSVDAAWNLVNTNHTVHITSSDANATLPADAALVNGSHTFSVTLKTAGSRTVTASDVTLPALTGNTSSSLTVNPAAYVGLQVLMPGETAAPGTASGKTGTPTARSAGTSFNTLTVNAVDALWNIVPTNATVSITSSDTNAVLPANSALGSGGTKINFPFTFKTAGAQTITATDVAHTDKTGTSAVTSVSPGAYTKLQVLVPGETVVPGSASGKIGTPLVQGNDVPFNVTVRSVDANWNLISTNDTVRLSSSDASAVLPAANALASGTQTFNVTLNTGGTNLTVTASNLTHTFITPATSAAITVNAKQAQTITFAALADKTNGTPAFFLSATASSGLPVSFSIVSGPAVISGGTNVALTGGAGLVTVRASQAGDANYDPAPDVEQSFTVHPAGGVPTIAFIPDQTNYVDQPFLVELMASDAETPTNLLRLTLTTSNPTLVDTNKDVLIRWFADGGPSFMPRWYATIAPTFGQTGTATNTITVSDGTNSSSTTFVLTVIPPQAGAVRFANTDAITLPASGVASQYPSTMTVTGVVGTVTNIVLSFSRLSHQNPNDLHMLLVSPSGQAMVIWSKVGGGGSLGGTPPDHAVTNTTATLTDSAPDFSPLPDFYYLWTERFRPADYSSGNPPANNFPAPAPAGPYTPTLASNAFNYAFNGQAANGTWSLYIYDDQAPYTGSIVGGWSLTVAATAFQPPTITDIGNQTIVTNTSTAALPFTISDSDTPVESLTLSTASSNPTLVPTNNIVLGGSGSNRTVTVTPAANQTGTATITIAVNDGVTTVSDTFLVTVTTGNTPPAITPISDKTTLVSRPVGPFDVNATDVQTPGSVFLSGTSSDTNLVPNGNIVFYNGPGQRTLTVTPAGGMTGTATITVSASDGSLSSQATFLLSVGGPVGATSLFDNTNTISLPLQSAAAPYPSTIHVSGQVGLVTKVTLLLKDFNHSASQDLNALLVGPGGQKVIVFANVSGGATTNAAVNLDDAATYALPPLGYTALSGTYRPTDGGHGTFPAPAPGETYANALTAFNGASPNGDWSLYIFNKATGTGSGNIARGWSLAITTDTTNTAPGIAAVGDQATTVNTPTAELPFNISDAETAAASLVVTATSSDTNLVAVDNIVLGGTDMTRTVTVTPTSNQLGTATITLTVSDGSLTASNSFLLTVNPAALTVTADNFTRSYGDVNPVFTGGLVGVQAGDDITASFITTADTNSAVGSYLITVAFSDPGNKLGNYVVTTNEATLTITNALLLVTANNDAKSYDGLGYAGGNGVTYTGLMNGETGDVLGGVLTYGGTAQGATNVGSFSITPGGLTSGNYAITYANGNLNIVPAAITITADAQSKTYGAADPSLTYQITSGALIGSDTITGTLTRVAGENAGLYAITQGTLTAGTNYSLSFIGDNLTINPASLTGLVVSTLNPVRPGSNVTFTASFTAVAPGAGTPTGTVQFIVDGSAYGSPVTLNSGVAAISTSSLTHGTHTIAAAYAGDGNFLGSTNSLSPNQLVNEPPVATDDTVATHQNISVNVAASNLLINDSDADLDTLSVASVGPSSTQGGTVSLSSGTVTYTPPANFAGADSFAYTVVDSFGGTATGSVAVTVYSSTNQPERVVSLEPLEGGDMRLTVAGIPDHSYVVEASTNLTSWVPVSTNTADTNGLFIFIDSSATNYPSRYYRSVSH